MMDGAISLTTMVTLAVSVPPVLVAVIVYVAEEVTAVGVPPSAPDDESERPAGSDGETDHVTTVPPIEIAGVVVIAVPLVNVERACAVRDRSGRYSLTTTR